MRDSGAGSKTQTRGVKVRRVLLKGTEGRGVRGRTTARCELSRPGLEPSRQGETWTWSTGYNWVREGKAVEAVS